MHQLLLIPPVVSSRCDMVTGTVLPSINATYAATWRAAAGTHFAYYVAAARTGDGWFLWCSPAVRPRILCVEEETMAEFNGRLRQCVGRAGGALAVLAALSISGCGLFGIGGGGGEIVISLNDAPLEDGGTVDFGEISPEDGLSPAQRLSVKNDTSEPVEVSIAVLDPGGGEVAEEETLFRVQQGVTLTETINPLTDHSFANVGPTSDQSAFMANGDYTGLLEVNYDNGAGVSGSIATTLKGVFSRSDGRLQVVLEETPSGSSQVAVQRWSDGSTGVNWSRQQTRARLDSLPHTFFAGANELRIPNGDYGVVVFTAGSNFDGSNPFLQSSTSADSGYMGSATVAGDVEVSLGAADLVSLVNEPLTVDAAVADGAVFRAYWLPAVVGSEAVPDPYGSGGLSSLQASIGTFSSGSATAVTAPVLIPGEYNLFVHVDENNNASSEINAFQGLDPFEYAGSVTGVTVDGSGTSVAETDLVAAQGPFLVPLALNTPIVAPTETSEPYFIKFDRGYVAIRDQTANAAYGIYLTNASSPDIELTVGSDISGSYAIAGTSTASSGRTQQVGMNAGSSTSVRIEVERTVSGDDDISFDLLIQEAVMGGTDAGSAVAVDLDTPTWIGAINDDPTLEDSFFRFVASTATVTISLTSLTAGVDLTVMDDNQSVVVSESGGGESTLTEELAVTGLTIGETYYLNVLSLSSDSFGESVGLLEIES